MNKLRRSFINKFSSLIAISLLSPAIALSRPSNKIPGYFFEIIEKQQRLGEWITQHLTSTQKNNLIDSNFKVLAHLDKLTKHDIEHHIAEDFRSNRTINVQGVLFSSTESALLILAADPTLPNLIRQ